MVLGRTEGFMPWYWGKILCIYPFLEAVNYCTLEPFPPRKRYIVCPRITHLNRI
jgi:hypothetical protein